MLEYCLSRIILHLGITVVISSKLLAIIIVISIISTTVCRYQLSESTTDNRKHTSTPASSHLSN